MRIFVIALSILALFTMLMGCSTKEEKGDKKTVKIELVGTLDKKVPVKISSQNPSRAGFKFKNFEMSVPGTQEFYAGGPSEYRIEFSPAPKKLDIKLSLEGKELVRGQDYVQEIQDDGVSILLNIKD